MNRTDYVYVTLLEYNEKTSDAELYIECSDMPLPRPVLEYWEMRLYNGTIWVHTCNFSPQSDENRLTINGDILADYKRRGEIGDIP